MAKSFNPFEHQHAHFDEDEGGPLDPAQESLADALRVSFTVLKLVMLVLLVWYILSGMFNVQEQEVAVKLRFGNIVHERPDDQVLLPGGPHLALPYPVEQVVKIKTNPRTLRLDNDFFLEIPESDRDKSLADLASRANPSLNPERDSYLVTGDANIMHIRWQIEYNVGGKTSDSQFASKVINWLENVGDEETERQIVRAAAQNGIVQVVSTQTADALNDGLSSAVLSRIRLVTQETLDGLSAGLVVTKVASYDPLVPVRIQDAFSEVSKAETERRRGVETARKERAVTLNGMAGAAYEELWKMIQAYEVAYEGDDPKATEALEARLAAAYGNLNTGVEDGNAPIRGEVASIINSAKTYRTQIRQQFEAEADAFQSLLAQYEQSPRLVATREWEKIRQRIMSGRVRTFYKMSGSRAVLQVTPDPRQKKQWDREDVAANDAATVGETTP